MNPDSDSELAAKVAYLCQPSSFPDAPTAIEAVETHFAWVFLSRQYVYKLKKPIQFPHLDLSTLQARRSNCELEVALNRRLATNTYIGVVPLGRHGTDLQLEHDGDPVDWLVKMRCLPREETLESLLGQITASDPRLTAFVEKLVAFYATTARAPWSVEDYARSLRRQCLQSRDRLLLRELAAERDRVKAIVSQQLEFTDRNIDLLRQRIEQRRVVDAHGDLRPEHIFLIDPPQIIDCLEFSTELRQLDTAEELSFLALECDLRRRADIGSRLLDLYSSACADEVPEALFHYYRSRRALVRAFLSAWHIEETRDSEALERWLRQTRWYIAEAASSIERAHR